jgi:eukaryotic-like serine/threonine-protein kinase
VGPVLAERSAFQRKAIQPQLIRLIIRRGTLSATTTDSSEALGPGDMVGKYRISARLGEGAMGVVYSAVHERLGRPVAIKVLRRELSENTELSSRFQMEAELVTRIGHPNIVAVYDFGRLADGCLYYVMEMIAGDSLRARLKRGTLSDQEIVEVFGPLLSAVRAAHEIGVVHRDLKPDDGFSMHRDGRILEKNGRGIVAERC